ncbi:MAG: HNH endonuclease, partial [Brevibacterium sp.]|nr:HNH endonuclease [Brevibacterium sp.]
MNDDSSDCGVRSDGSDSSTFSGRCLDIDEDSPFKDLSAVYACSDQAQFAALDATSGIFVREVAHYLGLAGPNLTVPYIFTSLADTVQRHSGRKRPGARSDTRTSEYAGNREENAGQGTVAGDGVHSPTSSRKNDSSRKKDRGARRRMRREQRAAREHPEQLPDFPAFKPTSTFNGWTHQYAWAEDISEYSALLGATTTGAYKHITTAMTLVHGLPKFHQRCCDGDFTIEHVAFVTRRCRDVEFRYLPSIDDYLADRRADITIETFKRSLALKIAATQPAQETLEKVAVRRRVDISTGDDGTAYLTLTGPAPELNACYRRVEAFARSVYTGN